MRDFIRSSIHSSAAVALLMLAGCGDGAPSVVSSNTEATVSGVVRVDGVPASGGEVTFDPSNINRSSAAPRQAPIGNDGSYTIKTLVGQNTIKLSGGVAKKNQILQRMQKSLDVQSGTNTFDMDFSAK